MYPKPASCELCGAEYMQRTSANKFCHNDDCKKLRQSLRWEKWSLKDGSREMQNEYQRRYRKETHYGRKWEVRKKYGLEWDDYLALLDEFNHQCAICGESDDICVDHCHESGRVRGILCRLHNSALGSFRDNVEYLTKAIKYLEERSVRTEIVEDWHGLAKETP